MKGQFMVVSAVIGSLILISTGAYINEFEEEDLEPIHGQHSYDDIRQEIGDEGIKIEDLSQDEKYQFERLLQLSSYSYDNLSYDSSCVEVNLASPTRNYSVNCMN